METNASAKVTVCSPQRLEELGLQQGDIIPPDTPPASSVSGSSRNSRSATSSIRNGVGRSSSVRGSWFTVGWSQVELDAASVSAVAADRPDDARTRPASTHVHQQHDRSSLSKTGSFTQETIVEECTFACRSGAWSALADEENVKLNPSAAFQGKPEGDDRFDQYAVFINLERRAAVELMRSRSMFPDTDRSRFYLEGE
jgi:hypothetical protein